MSMDKALGAAWHVSETIKKLINYNYQMQNVFSSLNNENTPPVCYLVIVTNLNFLSSSRSHSSSHSRSGHGQGQGQDMVRSWSGQV